MGEINSAQYSSVFPRFLLSLGFHPLGEDAKSCESPWLLVETAFFTPLSVDLGWSFSGVFLEFCYKAVNRRPKVVCSHPTSSTSHRSPSIWPTNSSGREPGKSSYGPSLSPSCATSRSTPAVS